MRAALLLSLLLVACGGLWTERPTQLPLGGDRECSDPVFGQAAAQCCMAHDAAFWAGGTRQDFHLANAEFLACMLLWGVPRDIAVARWQAVEAFGWSSWRETQHRTRGPARHHGGADASRSP